MDPRKIFQIHRTARFYVTTFYFQVSIKLMILLVISQPLDEYSSMNAIRMRKRIHIYIYIGMDVCGVSSTELMLKMNQSSLFMLDQFQWRNQDL